MSVYVLPLKDGEKALDCGVVHVLWYPYGAGEIIALPVSKSMPSFGCLRFFRSNRDVRDVKKPDASLKIKAIAAVLTTTLTTKGRLIVSTVSRDIG